MAETHLASFVSASRYAVMFATLCILAVALIMYRRQAMTRSSFLLATAATLAVGGFLALTLH